MLPASEDTQARLLDLYRHTDPRLAVALEARMRLTALGPTAVSDASMSDGAPLAAPGIAGVRAYFAEAAGTAARLLAKAVMECKGRIADGLTIAESFEQAKLFPKLVIRMLRIGELTGELDKSLTNVSYFYDRENRLRRW